MHLSTEQTFCLRLASLHISDHIGEPGVAVCVFKDGLNSHGVFLAGICQDRMFNVTDGLDR